jgi:hypothetical protein
MYEHPYCVSEHPYFVGEILESFTEEGAKRQTHKPDTTNSREQFLTLSCRIKLLCCNEPSKEA